MKGPGVHSFLILRCGELWPRQIGCSARRQKSTASAQSLCKRRTIVSCFMTAVRFSAACHLDADLIEYGKLSAQTNRCRHVLSVPDAIEIGLSIIASGDSSTAGRLVSKWSRAVWQKSEIVYINTLAIFNLRSLKTAVRYCSCHLQQYKWINAAVQTADATYNLHSAAPCLLFFTAHEFSFFTLHFLEN